jgi:hypothetical protein
MTSLIATEQPLVRGYKRARLIKRFLRLPFDDASFRVRGFSSEDLSIQMALENVGRTFIGGYNTALEANNVEEIVAYAGRVPQLERGFAVEGASMGAAVVDALSFGRSLLAACVHAFERDFTYLVHVGAGWSLARVPWRRRRIISLLDPIHKWLVFDGLGFHDAYFYHRNALNGWRRWNSGYFSNAYDQGLGRGLWFVAGGSLRNFTRLIPTLSSNRHGDLWSGMALAMAYAGPAKGDEYTHAYREACDSRDHFAQGIAFACEARVRAGYVPGHTELAAQVVWGIGAQELSKLVRDVRATLPAVEHELPRYEIWRRRVAETHRYAVGQRP